MTAPTLLRDASGGTLPEWAVASPGRREHMARVAGLLAGWADELDLAESERVRWTSVGYLHDALRDAEPETLRPSVPPTLRTLPGPVLHGPAAAEKLRVDGVIDGELLEAVAWHTVGSARLGRLGRALYCADFLEPGRAFLPEWRAELRTRLPGDLNAVTREILQARIQHVVDRGLPLLAGTVAFWNRLAEES